MSSTDDLPDLPALETARAGSAELAVLALAFGPFLLLMLGNLAWAYLKYRDYIELRWQIIAALVLAILTVEMLRGLWAYFSYATDRDGLHLRGVVRRRSIPWSDVTRAWTSKSLLKSTVLSLQARSGRAVTICGVGGEAVLLASIWQHLRRWNRAGDIKLTEPALSLWREIPERVPAEMTWRGSRAEQILALAMTALFIAATALLLGSALNPPDVRLLLMVIMMGAVAGVVLKVVFLPFAFETATQASTNPDGLTVRLLGGEVFIRWSAITAARWEAHQIVLRANEPRQTARISLQMGNRESEHLALCIIRHLRSAPSPLAIPLPITVDGDPATLLQPRYAHASSERLRAAFLASLEPATRRRMRMLYSLEIGSVFAGVALAICAMLTDPVGRISHRLFAGAGARYFFPPETMNVVFPLLIASVAICIWLADKLTNRLAEPYRDIWRQFSKLGVSERFARYAPYGVGAAAVASVAVIALSVATYTCISDRGMTIGRFGHLRGEFHSWSQVRRIEQTKHLSGYGWSVYRVTFSDGSSWRMSEGALRSPYRDNLGPAVYEISHKSGVEVSFRQVLPRD